MTSPSKDTPAIIGQLAEAAGKIGFVPKDKQTNFGERYKYRGIDGVLGAAGPALRDVGVSVRAERIEILEREVRLTTKGTPMIFSVIRARFVFTSSLDGSEFPSEAIGEAQDVGDKSLTKAQSIALRTAIINTLLLPPNDPSLDTEHGEQHEVAPPKKKAGKAKKADKFLTRKRIDKFAKAIAEASIEKLEELGNIWLKLDAKDPARQELRECLDLRKSELAEALGTDTSASPDTGDGD